MHISWMSRTVMALVQRAAIRLFLVIAMARIIATRFEAMQTTTRLIKDAVIYGTFSKTNFLLNRSMQSGICTMSPRRHSCINYF
jgi:hypothetical protein